MDKTKLKLYLLCGLLAASLLFIVLRERYVQKAIAKYSGKQKSSSGYFLGRDEVFEQLPMDTNAIIFLGTSLTEGFELNEFFKNLNFKNRGIVGDGVKGISRRLRPLITMKPSKIFVEAGVNDLTEMTNDTLLNYYLTICKKLKNSLPRTQIYVQSIFPVCEGTFRISEDIEDINRQIDELNVRLANLAKQQGLIYLEINSALKKEGKLNQDFTTDGVHLNGKGYTIWANQIATHLR